MNVCTQRTTRNQLCDVPIDRCERDCYLHSKRDLSTLSYYESRYTEDGLTKIEIAIGRGRGWRRPA